jgi:autotransporter-associated beta strand protein
LRKPRFAEVNLVVNNAAVTFTQLQQIASGKTLTINGAGGAVTFAGTGNNVLGAVSFVNNGGVTTPQITGGTVVMASLAAQNDNLSATPTVASIVNLNGASLTITTSGLSVVDLSITGQILDNTASVLTGLVKAGAGSLVLTSSTSTFGGGVALNAGTLILDASSTSTSGTVTAGPRRSSA